jgi:hypothetical protein
MKFVLLSLIFVHIASTSHHTIAIQLENHALNQINKINQFERVEFVLISKFKKFEFFNIENKNINTNKLIKNIFIS